MPRRLKRLVRRLQELADPTRRARTRDDLLRAVGAAEQEAGRAARLVHVNIPTAPGDEGAPYLSFQLDRQRLREVRRREGNYMLRTNLSGRTPGELWEQYMRLVEVEEAFRNLKGELSVRPIWHQTQARIEAHVFTRFLAYCLHVSLRARLCSLAPGLTPRSVLEKLSGLQMVDVRIPTTDGRELVLSRYTKPTAEQKLLIDQLRMDLPEQPRPRITSTGDVAA